MKVMTVNTSETFFGGKMAKNRLKMDVFYANIL